MRDITAIITSNSYTSRRMNRHLLFLAPCAFSSGGTYKTARKCPRRHVQVYASTVPPSSDDDPSWADLARSIGASDETPIRPAPEWKLPDDKGPSTADASAAWSAWNIASARPPPREAPRDPRAETDFWRSAASELTSSASSSPQPSSTPAPTPAYPESASQSDIWKMARGVTGEMTDLQNRLRADLDRYNPEENTDQYRDIARELVGPKSDEPWAEADPARPGAMGEAKEGEEGAEAGSGWNPDVDWKRFDDIRREQVLQQEKEARKEVAHAADKDRQAAFQRTEDSTKDVAEQSFSYVDEDGNELSPEEVQYAMQTGAVFLDEVGTEIGRGVGASDLQQENVDEAPSIALPDGSMPGFITNRFKSSGTYGVGWSGAEDEIRSMQEQGVPLRDPKADTEAWRAAARELNIDVEPSVGENSADVGTGQEIAIPQEAESTRVDPVLDVVDEQVVRDPQRQSETSADTGPVDGSSTDESSLWSGWRQSDDNWSAATETVDTRDPKKEVDIWLSSARELIGNVDNKSEQLQTEAPSSSEDKRAWDSWRAADAKWGAARADGGDDSSQQASHNSWTVKDERSDWGAGLNGKASSDRSAWENWNKVKGSTFGGDSSLWWSARSDSASRVSSGITKNAKSNASEWVSAAREVTGAESAAPNPLQSNSFDQQPKAENSDSTLEFWKDIAKDISVDDGGIRIEENSNEGL